MEKSKISIFEANWSAKEDEFSEQEKSLKKKELQRVFEAQYDRAEDKIIEQKKKVNNMLKNKFSNFSLNDYRQALSEIKDYENVQKELIDLYIEFFGEELRR